MQRRRRWGAPVVASAPEMEGIEDLQLIDVSLVAKTEVGLVEVPGLVLAFDRAGMTVRRRTGEHVSLLPWAILRRFSSQLQRDDRPGIARRVELEVESDRRRHEFILYHVEPFALTGALRTLSSRYAGGDLLAPPQGRRRR
jgi:hypothetical protein